MLVPVVAESWLEACVSKRRAVEMRGHIYEGYTRGVSGREGGLREGEPGVLRTKREATVTVKGGSAVHADSGLADVAHILVEARLRAQPGGPSSRAAETNRTAAQKCFGRRMSLHDLSLSLQTDTTLTLTSTLY